MEKKSLICYTFNKINPIKRKQFDRKMFGTLEKTHNGKYVAKIKGLLTNLNYEKPVKSTILIDQKYEKKIISILNEYNAKIKVFCVID